MLERSADAKILAKKKKNYVKHVQEPHFFNSSFSFHHFFICQSCVWRQVLLRIES